MKTTTSTEEWRERETERERGGGREIERGRELSYLVVETVGFGLLLLRWRLLLVAFYTVGRGLGRVWRGGIAARRVERGERRVRMIPKTTANQ